MSAPMKNFAGEFEVEECKNIPEELDLTSVKLNPLKVLYCENVHLPHKEPTTYNNLVEYENVVVRGNVPKSAASRRGRGKQHIESRSRVSILQSQKKVDSDSSGNDEAMAKLIERKKKMNRNVMNRMTSNSNTVVSNHVNSDHVRSFSCLDVCKARQTTSGVYSV